MTTQMFSMKGLECILPKAQLKSPLLYHQQQTVIEPLFPWCENPVVHEDL